MKRSSCGILPLLLVSMADAFVVKTSLASSSSVHTPLNMVEKVQVCGFKDCKRAGGGAKLQKAITQVLEENGMQDQVIVEGCDCQGECGYGPNIVVDGQLINGVRGREAIYQALGIKAPVSES